MKQYKAFVESADSVPLGREVELWLIDEDSGEQFKATVVLVAEQDPELPELRLYKGGKHLDTGRFDMPPLYIKSMVREDTEDDEPITIHRSKRLGQRKGHLIQSLIREAERNME